MVAALRPLAAGTWLAYSAKRMARGAEERDAMLRAVMAFAMLFLSSAQLYAQTDKVDSDKYRSQFEELLNKLKRNAPKTVPKAEDKIQGPVDPCKINPKLPQCSHM